MNSTRQQKVGRLIQKELGLLFQEKARTDFSGKMITVTTVRMTPDLGLARVYVSIFSLNKEDDFISVINEKVKTLRHELGIRVRHQIRIIPELIFILDDSLDYMDNIDALLKK